MDNKDLTFSDALVHLKKGLTVTRKAWLHTGQRYIFLVSGSKFKVNRPPLLGIFKEGTEVKYLPHVDCQYDTGVGVYTFTQPDVLADDWFVLNLSDN